VSSDDTSRPDPHGVHLTWVDAHDRTQRISDATAERLHAVIGEPPADLEERVPVVTRPGRDPGLGAVDVLCEDGETRHVDGALPEDFPLGYHQVQVGGHTRRLIVSPGRCWLPEGWRAWGWTAQLYAARSSTSWGMGDLGDLRSIRTWAQEQGAGFVLVNPLHAVAPVLPQEASPYLPASRRFRNPLYLRVDDVPGADRLDLADLRERAARLNAADLVDRDEVWTVKHEALWRIFVSRDGTDAFERWRAEQGRPLEEYAVWAVLSGEHGPDWREWPEGLRRPDSDEVADYARAHAQQVAFHAWLQWQLEVQLTEASGDLAVLQDLPIGVDGGGVDAWAWEEQLARGVTVGAPPDEFNAAGQDWGSPPFIPWRLRLSGYDAFIESIRSTMASAGGLRIDHVMGLFRLWWVPEDGGPADGAYVRYPSEDMLDIVALESHRARALVVGEDLGTVEPGVREALAEHAILSYRLLLFEDDDPATWPVSAMAAVTTHDLPTVAGLWSGADMADQAEHGLGDETSRARDRDALLTPLRAGADLDDDASAEDATLAAYRLLARAPSVLVSATLEDAVGDPRRPNMPGTTDRANWCLPLPVLVDDLPGHEGAAAVAEALRAGLDHSR
jgi:4-alpha-glucanotransferase